MSSAFGTGILTNAPHSFNGSFMLAYPNAGNIKFNGNFDQSVPKCEVCPAHLTFQQRKDLVGTKGILEGSFVGPLKLTLKLDDDIVMDGELSTPIAEEYKVTGFVNWPGA